MEVAGQFCFWPPGVGREKGVQRSPRWDRASAGRPGRGFSLPGAGARLLGSVSSFSDSADRGSCRCCGLIYFMHKPINIRDFNSRNCLVNTHTHTHLATDPAAFS